MVYFPNMQTLQFSYLTKCVKLTRLIPPWLPSPAPTPRRLGLAFRARANCAAMSRNPAWPQSNEQPRSGCFFACHPPCQLGLPSGKLLHNCGKWPLNYWAFQRVHHAHRCVFWPMCRTKSSCLSRFRGNHLDRSMFNHVSPFFTIVHHFSPCFIIR